MGMLRVQYCKVPVILYRFGMCVCILVTLVSCAQTAGTIWFIFTYWKPMLMGALY